MLKSLGIEAYPVLVFSGDPTCVRREWPSPQQFNHYIVGIRVSEGTGDPTVIEHPSLGRLLIFDPTDQYTPVGDLPHHLQGSLGLVAAGEEGDLVRMPATPSEANRLDRVVEAILSPEGAISARVSERSFGQAAAVERRLFRLGSGSQYSEWIERWISMYVSGAEVNSIEPFDEADDGRFSLDVEFSAPGYARLMRDRLMVLKPAVVSRRTGVPLPAKERRHPIVLKGEAYTERATFRLPAGFEVDELPASDEFSCPFGEYTVGSEVGDGYLTFRRSLIVRDSVLPAENYEEVRSFFERIRKAEQSPVVLIRK